jgi:hypothetical protein
VERAVRSDRPDRSGRLGDARRRDDAGFSMILTVVSLVVVALLVLLATMSTFGSSGSSVGSVSGNPEVNAAEDLQAQQSLSTALTSASAAGGGVGGIAGIGSGALGADSGGGADGGVSAGAGVSIAQLSAANPSLTFVAGPTTSPTTVSVTTDPSLPGSVTMATRSSDGVCWLVWHSPSVTTWYGAQTHLASCSAPALASPPPPGSVSSTAIGWQTGSFPAV